VGIGKQYGNEIGVAVLERSLAAPACGNEIPAYRRRKIGNPAYCAYP